jgi:hypothetical protein
MTGTLLALALACAGPAIGGCAGVVADAGPGAQRPPQHPHAPQRPAPGDAAVAEGEEEEDVETEAQMFRTIEDVFGRKGEVRDGVYRLVTPRSDLFVTMEGMDVPTGAFIESDFRFWHCPCGKLLVNGQFALADHEVNDVVDELHEGRLHVVAIAPLLLHEHPRLLMVRFQAEGRSRAIAEALRSALSYTGEERNRAQPIDIAPAREE